MDNQSVPACASCKHERLLTTLEGLLAIRATDAVNALQEASNLVAAALDADKVDIFVIDPSIDTLVALGTSDTPMGRRQIALGLNRMPLSNGGRAAESFIYGQSYINGHVDEDAGELPGIKHPLGVRSAIMVPLDVDGVRRGLVQVNCAQPGRFSAADLVFLKAVTHWIGMVFHRSEMSESIAREAVEATRRAAADELIAVLAHDLRAPLTPVRGYLELIIREAEKAGHALYATYSRVAQRGTDRLLALIDNLLDATRLDQGLFVVVPGVVDLSALTEDTALVLQTARHPIDVRADETVVVECDPNRVRQVIENLVTNAQRHSPDGMPVVVTCGCERREQTTWAVVTVQNQGPGIAPELLPHLFTQYARGKSNHGLGLGLYLAHGIAEAHGGTLTVDSKHGHGATFRLSLPVPQDLD